MAVFSADYTLNKEHGASVVDYCLVVSLISMAVIVSIVNLSHYTGQVFCNGTGGIRISAEPGHYDPDPSTPGSWFDPNSPDGCTYINGGDTENDRGDDCGGGNCGYY